MYFIDSWAFDTPQCMGQELSLWAECTCECRRNMDADYHFAAQFTADLIAMNHTDFICTSTFQEIAGTEVRDHLLNIARSDKQQGMRPSSSLNRGGSAVTFVLCTLPNLKSTHGNSHRAGEPRPV